MSTIGKNRLAIYDLFYRYPPCDYIYNKKLNVLIIGNGWVGNEAFKAMFWDGQYPGVDLNITIASNNAKQYEEALKEKLPGLGDFADFNGNRTSKYHYANIDIRDVSFDEIKETGITDAMAAEDCMNLQNQNIIVVSVGASEINGLLGVIISDLIKDNPQRVLLAVYGSEEISAPSNVEYVSFSSEVDIDTSELMKLAANINYVYDAKYNNFTINRKHSIEKYLAKYKKEFEETPEDTGDIFISLTNFTGMDYTADSSLAQAVHMPMKLDYCFHGGTAVEMTAELVKIINEHGKKFNLLAALEHKRWCAYMAIRACRMPKRDELGYLYSNGNNHKDDKNNLHICMCECGQNGATLDRASRRWGERVPDEMGKFKARFKNLSDLDWASLYCHQRLSDKMNSSNFDEIIDAVSSCEGSLTDEETTDALKDYEVALKKLVARQEDVNALALYNLAINILMKTPQYEQIKDVVKTSDEKLKWAKERHKRIDFLSYDVQFISMIPICLKLIKNDSTIITFTNGQAANDVIVPWILCAEKTVFVEFYPDSSFEGKKDAVRKFFNLHGNNTEPEFDMITNLKIESIKEKIGFLLEKYNDVIFNITPNIPPTILLALGEFAGRVQMVSYDSYRGLSYFNFNDMLPHRTEDMSLDVSDYLSLMQGKINDPYGFLMPYKKCRYVENFFWTHSTVRTFGDRPKLKCYSEWNSVIIQNFLQGKPNASTSVSESRADTKVLPLTSAVNYISDERFRGIAKSFLAILKSENIISAYTEAEDRKSISFQIKDNDFYRFVSEKGGNLFEMLVYYKLLHTCIFGDVRTGVAFQWKSGEGEPISNEIDVIATSGVDIVLVSCKTSPHIDNSYIYEIASEAAGFGGIAVLATSQDLSSPNNCNHNAVIRAQAMNVALIDQHILRDEELLKYAITLILSGKYKGPENFELPKH